MNTTIALAAGRGRVLMQFDDPEDHISRRILRRRDWYERDLLEDVSRRRIRGTAIDVGAHVGNHTLWFAAACQLDVVAIEPNPVTRTQLERHVTLNRLDDRIRILAAAAGAREGRARLEAPNPANTGMTRTVEDADGETPVVTIDSLGISDVSVIKIDVEGQEIEILEGARDTIERFMPLLYIEAADEQALNRLEAFLEPLGYSRFGRFALTPTYGFAAAGATEIRLSTTIMAHPRRQRFVGELISRLDGPATLTWDRQDNRWETGRRALLAVEMDATHHLVLQDDAIICRDLLAGARAAIAEHPDSPISLYLGRQRPHGPKFAKLVAEARASHERWISFPELCWGVAIILPAGLIDPIVRCGDAHPRIANYDRRVSRYLEQQRIPTWHTLPSLVDHRAGVDNPSLVPGRTGTNRIAHWFIGAEQSPLDAIEGAADAQILEVQAG